MERLQLKRKKIESSFWELFLLWTSWISPWMAKWLCHHYQNAVFLSIEVIAPRFVVVPDSIIIVSFKKTFTTSFWKNCVLLQFVMTFGSLCYTLSFYKAPVYLSFYLSVFCLSPSYSIVCLYPFCSLPRSPPLFSPPPSLLLTWCALFFPWKTKLAQWT